MLQTLVFPPLTNLLSQGAEMDDQELLELISSSSTMSKKLADYGAQKSSAISTARRLAEFLDNEEMVATQGLACKFVIAKVRNRSLPLACHSLCLQISQFFPITSDICLPFPFETQATH